MREEIEPGLGALAAEASVRVLILWGGGRGHFCARGDVKLMQSRRMGAAKGRTRVEAMNRAVRALVHFRAPTIAMVDGFAVGAGCNLALACDLVVASDRARFGEVFARIGLIPDGGGTYLLPRRVGLAKAKELVFTGHRRGRSRAHRADQPRGLGRRARGPDPSARPADRRRAAAGPRPGEVSREPVARSRSRGKPCLGGARAGDDDRVGGPP